MDCKYRTGAVVFVMKSLHILLPLEDAVAELHVRQHDASLRARVEAYLEDDVPQYLRDAPAVLLMRYIATPNFETLRFLDETARVGMRGIITEDAKDVFWPHNSLKRALIKMPICTRVTKKAGKRNELFEDISISNVTQAVKQPFGTIETFWNEPLMRFHHTLLKRLAHTPYEVHDDTSWVDRHSRGTPLDQYKKLLALFLVHGILAEDYVLDDKAEQSFVQEVLLPAHEHVHSLFGVTPLIVPLVPEGPESQKFWIGYPAGVRDIIKKQYTRI